MDIAPAFALDDGVSTSDRVLVVDDERHVLSAVRRTLRPHGYEVLTAGGGDEALEILQREPVDVIISDMRMPGINGAELLRASRAMAPDAVRILLTGHADVSATARAVNEGEIFRFLLKPWEDVLLLQAIAEGLQRRALQRERDALSALAHQQQAELQRLNGLLEQDLARQAARLDGATRQLRADFGATLRLLSSLVAARSGLSSACPPRVAQLVRGAARQLGLTSEQANDVVFAALLQDIGRLGLPDTLLQQPQLSLGTAERRVVHRHAELGAAHLAVLPSLAGAAAVLASLYENFDGSGVPGRLAGTDIPPGARLLRVVTDYVHLQAGVLHARRASAASALRWLRSRSHAEYDPRCIQALTDSLQPPARAASAQALVACHDLRAGMRLGKDVATGAGTLLLAQGQVLDDALIAQLRRVEDASGEFLWITVVQDDGSDLQPGA